MLYTMATRHDFLKESYRLRYKDIQGVEGGGCHLNVYLPQDVTSAETLPVVMMIRGGGFWVGAAHLIPYNQVHYLLDHKVVVVSIEHRLLPHCHIEEMRHDCLDALRYCQERLGEQVQEVHIDGSKIGVLGWSAGALLAIYLAHDASLNGGLGPLAISVTYPPTDMSGSNNRPKSDFESKLEADSTLKAQWDSLMHGPASSDWSPLPPGLMPGQLANVPPPQPMPERMIMFFAQIHSETLFTYLYDHDPPYTQPSPLDIADSHFPPTAIVMAESDKVIPISNSQALYDKLQAKGVPSALFTCHGMDHIQAECLATADPWPANRKAEWWEAITQNLDFVLDAMGVAF
ncbi:Alpha/Beta hydrolase protein [Kockovaella imperatae]|uniref:Alpha/Beta hydrolase protein n=1 Tax=Kockovaella imperatae TaxID=4999 RepID=A0A1Y1ULC0_9TREE|nr:Alpha/Beta hydrolase protein [Kockovaella imperatae]ORX38843.1 Alpha/Beta hydrolase protein [Kockovaella imperatae]